MREHNLRPHADIEVDIQAKKNGQITFTLRCNAGNIVDYSLVEYVDVKRKYSKLEPTKTIVVEKLILP